MNWNNIKNLSGLQFERWSAGDKYQGESAEISAEMGAKNLGFHVEILSPGMFSCPYHFHRHEEELFIVLDGKAMLRQNNQYREVTSGDIIHFGLSEENAHQFYNHTHKDFKFFALSANDENDIVEYPDSDKIYIRKQKKMFQHKNEVHYLTDEEEPEKYWDKKYLSQDSMDK